MSLTYTRAFSDCTVRLKHFQHWLNRSLNATLFFLRSTRKLIGQVLPLWSSSLCQFYRWGCEEEEPSVRRSGLCVGGAGLTAVCEGVNTFTLPSSQRLHLLPTVNVCELQFHNNVLHCKNHSFTVNYSLLELMYNLALPFCSMMQHAEFS